VRDRCVDGFFNSVYTRPQCTAVNSLADGNRAQAETFSVPRVEYRPSLIRRLLDCCSPSAIGGFVVTIVVAAIKRHAVWTQSHVGDEVSKVVPTCAHSYASAAVILVLVVFGVSATLAGGLPCHVLFGTTPMVIASRSSVLGAILRSQYALLAPTARGIATRQVVGLKISFLPATAPASPVVIMATLLGIGDHSEVSKLVADLHGSSIQTSREIC
jgi:hypothetical protein